MTLALAGQHRKTLAEDLAPGVYREWQQMARDSLQEQEDIEAADTQSFDDFLQEYLAKTPLSQCAETNYLVVEPTMLLSEAGRKLKEKRHGCLLVCDDDRRLTGLLTSQDFLRLAIILLD